MSSQQAISFVRQRIAENTPLDTICELVLDHCLADAGTLTTAGCDNMTMVVVAFLNGRTVEDWYEVIGSRVAAVKLANPSKNSPVTARKDMGAPKDRVEKTGGMLKRLFSSKSRSISAMTKK
jgi:protein phosphatase 2C family protein 2/3